MEMNLSYNTVCGLRDCVADCLQYVKKGKKILTLPTDDREMEVAILQEYVDILDEFLDDYNE